MNRTTHPRPSSPGLRPSTLIADSGSTKTDWALVAPDGTVSLLHTQGINPVHQDEQTITAILTSELLPQIAPQIADAPITAIYFYGSGVRPSEEPLMQRLLQSSLNPQQSTLNIEAHNDLLGAARALCGRSEGLACILGTGANSCLFDGHQIIVNTPPLGYILGDEGSGAVLGIRLLNALYKGLLPDAVRHEFEDEHGMTLGDIISRVYRQPMANRFLASLSPFVHAHLHLQAVNDMVVDNFRLFLQHNVRPYGRPDLPLFAVGSIAHYYKKQLSEAITSEGYTLGRIERSPLNLLIEYHKQ